VSPTEPDTLVQGCTQVAWVRFLPLSFADVSTPPTHLAHVID